MAKLVVFGALLIGLLAVVQASRFTVTTTVTEEPEQQGSCVEQMRPQSLQLRSCRQYLMAPFQKEQREKDECCEGLGRMSEQCRCEAMTSVVEDIEKMERGQQSQMQMQKEMEQIREAASDFPAQCNIGGPMKCQIPQPRLIRMFA